MGKILRFGGQHLFIPQQFHRIPIFLFRLDFHFIVRFLRNCAALRGLNQLGADGYHWRVCVEDKPVPGEAPPTKPSYSWWDIQDENAKLPVKQATQYQLSKFLSPPVAETESSTADAAAKAAKGAFKTLGKAMMGTDSGSSDQGPVVPVVAFKLLDLVKMHDDFKPLGGHLPAPRQQTSPKEYQPPPVRQAAVSQTATVAGHQVPVRPVAPSQPQHRQQQQHQRPSQPNPVQRAHQVPQQRAQPEPSLMDFGPTPVSAPSANRQFHHSSSMPASFDGSSGTESRAEKLKREYAQKNQASNRVWDDIDQRWVEVDPNVATVTRGTTAAPPGAVNEDIPKKKEIGISLDPANAVGKSAQVQAAVHKRVNEMRESQQKALQEVRDREDRKKREEAEEDLVRKKLEPIVKAWSEEHGKKKQLRALLANLHTILWPEADWKPISIGDILDDSKMKRCFHKASRVVHPDKTHHLDAEKRFLAKRIFDSLSQAKSDYDNGTR